MDKIINKLWKKSGKDAFNFVYDQYKQNGFAIINYIYGGNITNRNLFKDNGLSNLQKQQKLQYKNALLTGTVLLPDGIALQIFVFMYFLFIKKKLFWINNLNGTDYLKFFLQKLKTKTDNIKLILYGTYPDSIVKSVSFFKKIGYDVIYYQDGYRQFDRNSFDKIKKSETDTYVFIQGRTKIKTPLQELWTVDNVDNIQKNKFIVINSGGLFDSKDRGGNEIRAPKFIRFIKCERLRKALLYPQKGGFTKILSNFKLISTIFHKIILKK